MTQISQEPRPHHNPWTIPAAARPVAVDHPTALQPHQENVYTAGFNWPQTEGAENVRSAALATSAANINPVASNYASIARVRYVQDAAVMAYPIIRWIDPNDGFTKNKALGSLNGVNTQADFNLVDEGVPNGTSATLSSYVAGVGEYPSDRWFKVDSSSSQGVTFRQTGSAFKGWFQYMGLYRREITNDNSQANAIARLTYLQKAAVSAYPIARWTNPTDGTSHTTHLGSWKAIGMQEEFDLIAEGIPEGSTVQFSSYVAGVGEYNVRQDLGFTVNTTAPHGALFRQTVPPYGAEHHQRISVDHNRIFCIFFSATITEFETTTMHPSLRLNSLNRLPISSRRITQAVCDNPSRENIERFVALTDGMSTTKQQLEMLPVYYCLLDPARIPSSNELENSASNSDSSVIRDAIIPGLLAVEVLFDLPIPPAAGVDLWPRFWPWVQFLFLYHADIARFDIDLPSEEEFCVGVIIFTGCISPHQPTEQLIGSTPGFQAFVVRTWAILLHTGKDNQAARADGFTNVFLLLTPSCFDEIIAGAGGTVGDLAALVIAQVAVAMVDGNDTLSEDELSPLNNILNFVVDFDESGTPLERPLCSALIDAGFLVTATDIARTSSQTTIPLATDILRVCLVLLCNMLLTASGYRKLRDAIQSGLLPTVLLCAQRNISLEINRRLLCLLLDIFPAATVNCNVLADMGTAYMALEGTISEHGFHPKAWAAWTAFSDLLMERIEVLRDFDTRADVSLKACDNMECHIILEKTQLMRCTGCRDLLYCSRECQRLDWREGGHRDQCVVHRRQRIEIELAATPRERAFMRALLHYEFLALRTRIHAQWAEVLAAGPDIRCSTFFDYRMGEVRIKVGDVPPLISGKWKPELQQPYWEVMLARESRSGGRMVLNMMSIREGMESRVFLVPLRTNTPQVDHALKRVVASLGPESTLQDATRLVIQHSKSLNSLGIVEIH
ncbi:hypothetical protein C8R47DRAFT_1323494 [Mycena vitilis]|nr:hypothetical protein C8R47DRAFT_1323494 [Mycena vitilis]